MIKINATNTIFSLHILSFVEKCIISNDEKSPVKFVCNKIMPQIDKYKMMNRNMKKKNRSL